MCRRCGTTSYLQTERRVAGSWRGGGDERARSEQLPGDAAPARAPRRAPRPRAPLLARGPRPTARGALLRARSARVLARRVAMPVPRPRARGLGMGGHGRGPRGAPPHRGHFLLPPPRGFYPKMAAPRPRGPLRAERALGGRGYGGPSRHVGV